MIRKYPKSRRLYDTDASRYITLDDARPRVLGGETVTTSTNEDCTGEVLLGVIMRDVENGRGPNVEELRMFIMNYSAPKIVRQARPREAAGGSR